jgi:predicted membrane GTPase involved in stress response
VTIVADDKPLSCSADEKLRGGKISELFVYDNFSRAAVDVVDAGDICAVTGLSNVSIGETICSCDQPTPLPTITVCALLIQNPVFFAGMHRGLVNVMMPRC